MTEQTTVVEKPVRVEKADINLKSLLECGAHFGTKTQDWDPRMASFIYNRRNGVYIIDLEQTVQLWRRARKVIVENAARGGTILFIGTKAQSRVMLAEQAALCGSPFVETRWLGGTLTNFPVIQKSINKLNRLEEMVVKAEAKDTVLLHKKEIVALKKIIEKSIRNFGGVRNLKKLPDLVFIADVSKDHLALQECRALHIPVISLVDTNINPEPIQYPIPANDDATGTISLFTRAVAEAVLEGKVEFEAKKKTEEALKAKAKEEALKLKAESTASKTHVKKQNNKPSGVKVDYKKNS